MTTKHVAGNGRFETATNFDKLMEQVFTAGGKIDIGNYAVNLANQQKSKDDLETILKNEEKDDDAKANLVAAGEQLESDRKEQERERIRDMQNDYSQTYSDDDLDKLAWVGDMNDVWNIGGMNVSRRGLNDAVKNTRRNLNQIANDNGWDDATKADQDHWLSVIRQGTINNRPDIVNDAITHLRPETKAQLEAASKDEFGNVASNIVQSNSDKSVDTVASVGDRSTIYSMTDTNLSSSSNLAMGSACETVINAEIRPTKPFNASASAVLHAQNTPIIENIVALNQNTTAVTMQPRAQLASNEASF